MSDADRLRGESTSNSFVGINLAKLAIEKFYRLLETGRLPILRETWGRSSDESCEQQKAGAAAPRSTARASAVFI